MKTLYAVLLAVVLSAFSVSCKTNNGKVQGNPGDAVVAVPEFNADSAYLYVKTQVDFGPRVPNTKEHIACGNYLAGKLKEHGATITNQYADLTTFDGTILKARNIIGSYNTENKKRILLFAHWDTRPFADEDPDKKNYYTPIPGANDGASGVGVLLEIARQINMQAPRLGIDIIFFDAEDYGKTNEGFWALGSQYWARNPHTSNYNARFGILLDMVGGKNSVFKKEGHSEKYARGINRKVWNKAEELGYGNYFADGMIGAVTDDHYSVIEYLSIPCIDIIPHDFSDEGSPWHTLKDDMSRIDRSTLKAVGQTVLAVIYEEK